MSKQARSHWTRRANAFATASLLATASIAAALTPAASAQAHDGPSVEIKVIATGLNNPRGVVVDANSRVYVTEAGLGGGDESTGVQNGLGQSGAITAINHAASANPTQRRIITNLWSAAQDEGNGPEAIGTDGLSLSNGKLYAVNGAAGIPGLPFGHLTSIAHGVMTDISDVGSFDLKWTAEHAGEPWAGHQFPDSDPYGVLVSNGHRYVVDAASNTLNEVLANGSVRVLAYFPNTPFSDAVPTCVTRGPDGALYIGTLALADFFAGGPGTANVYRVDPTEVKGNLNSVLSVAKVWATGFSTITGCTFDQQGNFYAAEMFAGDVQIASFAHPATGRTIIGANQLVLPNGIAVGTDGSIYVSTHSSDVQAKQGKVVRIRLHQ